MHFKVNPTGCCERKGLVQVRYDLFLDDNTNFCCHFCEFEPEVTDEEIEFVGMLALDMAHKNYLKGDLDLNKNEPVKYSSDPKKKDACKKRASLIGK